jgi:hypothetical protein
MAGAKAAVVATVAAAVPTVSTQQTSLLYSTHAASLPANCVSFICYCCLFQLASVRMLPWAKAHLNPTGQALIISTVAGMAYFIVADKTILSMARKHSFEDAPDHLKNTSFH